MNGRDDVDIATDWLVGATDDEEIVLIADPYDFNPDYDL